MTRATEALAKVADVEASPLPAFNGQQMARALVAYRDVQASLDKNMPDQIIRLDGRPFRRKGYWRAITVAFNLSVELVEERREVFGALPNGAENFAYLVTYRATTTTGRSQTGDGACTAAEKSVGRMRATEHNVRSHAHTRAYNRAVSNLCGFGEVSAEEVEHDAPELDQADRGVAPGQAALKAPAVVEPSAGAAPPLEQSELPLKRPATVPGAGDHVVFVTDVTRTPTRNPKFTKFTLTVAGGPDWPANQNTVTTIREKWATLATDAMKANTPVRLRVKKTEYGYDIAAIERLDDQGQPLLIADDVNFRSS